MKRKHFAFFCVCAIVCLTTTGCGAKLIELTPEQEQSLVLYSAKVVSKYNKNQPGGMCFAKLDAKAVKDQEISEEDEQVTPDVSDGNSEVDPMDPQGEPTEQVSLSDALALDGIDLEVSSVSVADEYTSGEVIALTPNNGKQYLVVKFNATNTTEKEIYLDMLSKKCTFGLTIDGSMAASNEMTVLLDDLATYQGNIEPGKSKELVLLFQVTKNQVENANTYGFTVKADGTSMNVRL